MLKDKEYERDDLFIEMQLCIKKLNYMSTLQLSAMDLTRRKLHPERKQ